MADSSFYTGKIMTHFKGKDALSHMQEKKLEGSLSEPHGLELQGFAFACIDGARQLSSLLLFLSALALSGKLLLISGLSFIILFAGRSALLGQARLERLHRLAEQERYEIAHHRPQERAELKALYGSKGFKGELLDKVVDVLMADDDRLLKVMLEEEMGLSLEAYEHPLKPALGIVLSGLSVMALFAGSFLLGSWEGGILCLILIIGGTSLYNAYKEKNHMISALVWNLGVSLLATLFAYFALHSL